MLCCSVYPSALNIYIQVIKKKNISWSIFGVMKYLIVIEWTQRQRGEVQLSAEACQSWGVVCRTLSRHLHLLAEGKKGAGELGALLHCQQAPEPMLRIKLKPKLSKYLYYFHWLIAFQKIIKNNNNKNLCKYCMIREVRDLITCIQAPLSTLW